MAALSLYMLLSLFLFLRGLGIGSGSSNVVFTGMLFYAQVALTELSLGIANQLYPGYLIALNLLISTILLILTFRRYRDNIPDARADFKNAISAVKEIMRWENAGIFIVALFVFIWMAAALRFLPPRGIDDLFYHLPPIYESILQHKLVTLNINEGATMYPFLFPFNAELLFLWAAIFQHSQRSVDMVQFAAAIYAVAVIYALGRELGLNRRTAFFSSTLFLFAPVVLAQSGTTYVDIITNTCYLAGLFGALKYARSGDIRYLYLAGAAVGLMSGMKFNMIILGLALQLFIFLRPKTAYLNARRLSLYLFLCILLSSYWYVRNFILFGSPLYPLGAHINSTGILTISGGVGAAFFKDLLLKAKLLFVNDIGLGSLHGGYGILYWGAAFPSWIYCMWKSFRARQFTVLFFWLQGIIGILMLFAIPYDDFDFVPRYSLFAVGLGFLAFGKALTLFHDNRYKLLTLKASAIGLSMLAVIHLSNSICPVFDVDEAAADYINGTLRSPYKYLSKARWDLPSLATAWDALDYLTKDNSHPLYCYAAIYRSVLWLSPVYGSNLQNRVWNLMEQDAPDVPDAFLYHFSAQEDTLYLKKKIPIEDIATNPDYTLINQTSKTVLFIRKDYFNRENNKTLLASYYLKAYPASVEIAKRQKFESGIPIIAIPYFAGGLVYLQISGMLNNDVHSVLLGFEDRYVRNTKWPLVYTFINPLSGYRPLKVAEVATAEGPVAIYKNIRETQ
ncbi:MAG: glycosyltransferase family 39 protein [Candidatus Magnetominusculus sp. LBB02]|nr:glycosyltransferase family 39 protein [Candidatus Magnetominusculus sp. LBB02]